MPAQIYREVQRKGRESGRFLRENLRGKGDLRVRWRASHFSHQHQDSRNVALTLVEPTASLNLEVHTSDARAVRKAATVCATTVKIAAKRGGDRPPDPPPKTQKPLLTMADMVPEASSNGPNEKTCVQKQTTCGAGRGVAGREAALIFFPEFSTNTSRSRGRVGG